MRTRRVLRSPTVEPEPFDPAAFPGVDERLRADGGAASARWRELVDANTTIIADGAMGTMLFANGLLFGDPPEVWNLSKPDVIRRIHRGYLDAGSQILMTNTFGGNRMRLSLHGLAGPRRGAQPDRGHPGPERGGGRGRDGAGGR